ncbi:hypothetical protein [Marinococcus luteus]|uniref:hypothetical protein n=1 Tax=Marinococcus luteus TaxID=1122204 RepID=UPI002ACE720B|nr:hypothetical protein [Marinococcus luteus]
MGTKTPYALFHSNFFIFTGDASENKTEVKLKTPVQFSNGVKIESVYERPMLNSWCFSVRLSFKKRTRKSTEESAHYVLLCF